MKKTFKPRPDVCRGCSLHPDTSPDPLRCGGFVPPHCTCDHCRNRIARAFAEMSGRAPNTKCEAPLMAIGIAPGEEEERRQEPLVGPSGRILYAALRWVQYHTSQYHLAKLNLVNCRTTTQGHTKLVNRDPTPDEIVECMDRITRPILENYDGTLLILGGLAFSVLTQGEYGSFAESRGYRIEPVLSAPPARIIRLNTPRRTRRPAKPKPPRLCGCGATLPPRKRKCDGCKATAKKRESTK